MDSAELATWFNIVHTDAPDGNYRHTWCRQAIAGGWKEHFPRIVQYLERAHSDARNYFHDAIYPSLDPVPSQRALPSYPNDMPLKTKKGFFGEALCGMFTEASEIVGGDKWIVPAFLFRLHQAAEEHLHRLMIGESVPTDIPGRTGSDFIAIALDKDGQITKFLSGEAKCHATFNVTQCGAFLHGMSKAGSIPVSLPQLRRILIDQNDPQLEGLIASIESIYFNESYHRIPKCNLLLYLFDKPGVVKYDSARIT